MGGDHGPSVVIPAVVRAISALPPEVSFLLHGDEAVIKAGFAKHPEALRRVEIRHAERVVAMDEKPAQALRRGKGTSMWAAVEAVRDGQAVAALSAGNTGALMAISRLILRMCADLERPALVTSIPTPNGVTTFLDVGANIDCDAARLVEFAMMGEAYHRAAHGMPKPTVGLLNVGSEEMKGHEEVREAHRILREGKLDLDYRGFVEGDDITRGRIDVIVTDGFTGNVTMKAMEGAARFMTSELRASLGSTLLSRLGYVMARSALLRFRARMTPIPAAPLLGLNSIVVKCHGGASDRDFAMAIRLAVDLARSDFSAEIERNMRRLPDALAAPTPTSTPASNGADPQGATE